jgi:transcriptional regulator NrdR family protein
MIERIKKRNGKVEKFSRHKLLRSVQISLQSAGTDYAKIEEKIADTAIAKLGRKRTVDTEDIRDAVCYALKRHNRHEACDFYSLVWLHAKPVKIKYVLKRHGRKEKFSIEKLFRSVKKAFAGAHVKDGRVLQFVMKDVINLLNKQPTNKVMQTAEIRDLVEYVLVKRGLDNVARHYIMYRYM